MGGAEPAPDERPVKDAVGTGAPQAPRAKGCTMTQAKGSHEKWTAPGGHSTIIKAGEKTQTPDTARQIQ